MKKFLFVLIVLIILAGTVFFLGWAQLTVPPGSYGVMRTKTHGLEARTIKSGEFRWFWYKVIPTNAQVSVYTLVPVKRPVTVSGGLPSGQVYASLAGLDADFSWEISGEISFSLNPDFLPEFTAKGSISDDAGLRTAEENLAVNIENLVIQRLKAYADNDDTEKIENLLVASSLPELDSDILRAFPEIENLTCTIRVVRFPDFALFRSVKALYAEYLARQNAILSQDVAFEAERRITSKLRVEELTQMGELLNKYPVLIQYLTIEKDIPAESPPAP